MYKPNQQIVVNGVEYLWPFDPTVKFMSSETGTAFICTCGATKTAPYCDGSHIEVNNKSLGNGVG